MDLSASFFFLFFVHILTITLDRQRIKRKVKDIISIVILCSFTFINHLNANSESLQSYCPFPTFFGKGDSGEG